MSKVLIVGGGPAGMFAAITAAESGHEVHLFEKNDKLGRKLFITGKGRCNLTNSCDMSGLYNAVVRNPKFMFSSFNRFNNTDIMDFFANLGVELKTERGGRVFPSSDHSSDVINALVRKIKKENVHVYTGECVKTVRKNEDSLFVVECASRREHTGNCCILATGGLSYPLTGSTGDGFTFARKLGHHVTKCLPALVPIETHEMWVRSLQGLSLKNVRLTAVYNGKKVFEDFGEMLFTHFGISGPLVLSFSSICGAEIQTGKTGIYIDLKPALSMEQVVNRLENDFSLYQKKQFKNSLAKLFPARLIPVMVSLSEIDGERQVYTLTKKELEKFAAFMKAIPISPLSLRGFSEAVVTNGGISVKEINPSTMESKIVPGLFFAGEMIDVDALTGGYNLQIAWSTGYAAGNNI